MSNEAETRRWNDDYWMSVWPKREELTNQVTDLLLDHLHPQPGEHVLDVGCGGGRSTLAAGTRVGRSGAVVGYDLSQPLLALARRRAEEQGSTNTLFVAGDAQTAAFEGAPFDAAVSQFGVMFFDDSVAAFANIHRHLKPGGRLAFVCWQSAEQNAWNIGPLVARYAPAPAPPAAGKSPTGPFALADVARTTDLLRAAGWTDVERTGYEMTVQVPPETLADEGQLAFAGVPEPDRPAAWEAVQGLLARFPGVGGRLEVPIAFQIFAARA
ncbi:MAG: class I SAM-dependent methyltransferase [Acidimicrobiaceae bacterium]|nr:class I SAM-dependent methyltransferase [Acidimicrobiaceae bacterium]